MCGFLIKSIASHLAGWGVSEFSRHQLFSSDKALFSEVTVLLTALFYFCMFMDKDGVEVHELAKKIEANIQPSYRKSLVNNLKGFNIWLNWKFFSW